MSVLQMHSGGAGGGPNIFKEMPLSELCLNTQQA